MSKEADIQDAKEKAEQARRVLSANEIYWADRWNAAKNPFEAWRDYKSKAQKAVRKPIIDAWLSAVSKYEAVKGRAA